MKSRRQRVIILSPEALVELLTGQIEIAEPLPEGTEIERYAEKWETHSAVIVVSHPSFDEVESGAYIPEHFLIVRRRLDGQDRLKTGDSHGQNAPDGKDADGQGEVGEGQNQV